MKNLLLLFLAGMVSMPLFSQAVSINESGAAPNVKSILDVSSITKGVLIPRMTTAQRLAIAPGASEEGMLVYDIELEKYIMFNGTVWEVVGDGLWQPHALGAYRDAKVGINAQPVTGVNLYVLGKSSEIGPGTSMISVLRSGTSTSTEGGTAWDVGSVDAGLKSYSFWGNLFSAGVAAYSFLDYNNSAALVAGKQDASTLSLLAYKDGSGKIWAGHFTGDARISGQLGLGINPNLQFQLHAESAVYDRMAYLYNTKNTTATTFGIYAGAFGTGSGAKRGGSFDANGGTGVNIGVRATASGGATNWAGYFAAGNVYINDNLAINTETMAAGYALSVNGKIISEELRIQDMADWPDYVFARDYPLPELYVLESAIKREGHLPGVPSAEDVETEGILVGEMQAVLLKQIEELTLYTIAQQKQIDALTQRIQTLESTTGRKNKTRCSHRP